MSLKIQKLIILEEMTSLLPMRQMLEFSSHIPDNNATKVNHSSFKSSIIKANIQGFFALKFQFLEKNYAGATDQDGTVANNPLRICAKYLHHRYCIWIVIGQIADIIRI